MTYDPVKVDVDSAYVGRLRERLVSLLAGDDDDDDDDEKR